MSKSVSGSTRKGGGAWRGCNYVVRVKMYVEKLIKAKRNLFHFPCSAARPAGIAARSPATLFSKFAQFSFRFRFRYFFGYFCLFFRILLFSSRVNQLNKSKGIHNFRTSCKIKFGKGKVRIWLSFTAGVVSISHRYCEYSLASELVGGGGRGI